MISKQTKLFIKQYWIFYFVGVIIVFGIKYFYSKADSDGLEWILAPTAWWVNLLSGIPFEKESHVGYINHHFRFIIAPSCSGVQFMIISFATLFFSFVHRMGTTGRGFCWIALSLGLSYLFTIFVNGFRIVFSIYLHSLDINSGWMTPERIHTIEGIVVYFVSLLIIYRIAEYISQKIAYMPEKNLQRTDFEYPDKSFTQIINKCIPPLFWYFLITLGIPVFNMAYKNDTEKFIEYAMLITTVCLSTIFLFYLAAIFLRFFGIGKKTYHSPFNPANHSSVKEIAARCPLISRR